MSFARCARCRVCSIDPSDLGVKLRGILDNQGWILVYVLLFIHLARIVPCRSGRDQRKSRAPSCCWAAVFGVDRKGV